MTEHILFLSYGKDSLACLGAIEKLGWPLDRIVHAEIWATCDISADLPPMVEFKKKADAIIKKRWGIEVEHISAIRGGSKTLTKDASTGSCKRESSQEPLRASLLPLEDGASTLNTEAILTYEKIFYKEIPARQGRIYGFPMRKGNWCNSDLKMAALRRAMKSFLQVPLRRGLKHTVVEYLGIAIDEPKRLERCDGVTKKSPLAEIGWTEADAWKWCEENDLLSPIYTTATRGGCWFCHNQGVDQLRQLRKNYPDLWALLMKWDLDSPVSFHSDGRTVHDFDRRFQLEDKGLVPTDRRFRWKMIEEGNE